MDLHGGNIYHYQHCLDFSVNLHPAGPPEAVVTALKRCLLHLSEYPQIGYLKLRHQIAEYEKVSADEVICGNGAAELIYAVCQAIRPKHALLPVPTFSEYARALTAVNGNLHRVFLQKKDKYCLTEDFTEVLRKLASGKEKPQIVFLCNPNNPTGRLIAPGLLRQILDICESEKIILVVDECFLDFVEAPEVHTLTGFLKSCPHLLILKAFTKRYAIPGLRLGYGLCGNSHLLDAMKGVLQPWNVSCMAAEAGIAALAENAYVTEGRSIVRRERLFLSDRLSALGFRVYPSDANYLLFEGPAQLFSDCAREGILIRDCSNFDGLEAGNYRIAVRKREENERLLTVLDRVMGAIS